MTNDTVATLNNPPGTNVARIGINNSTRTGKLLTNWPSIQTPHIFFPKEKFLLNRGGQREFGIPAGLEDDGHMKKFCHEGRGVTNSQDKRIDPACKCREFPSRGTISFQNRINVGQNTLDFFPGTKSKPWKRSMVKPSQPITRVGTQIDFTELGTNPECTRSDFTLVL